MAEMPQNKSKFAALVIKGMPKPSSRVGQGYESGPAGDVVSGQNDQLMIADEILSAVHARDASALTDALIAFMKTCDDDSGDEGASEEGEAPPPESR